MYIVSTIAHIHSVNILTSLRFEKRLNWRKILEKLSIFHRVFFKPKWRQCITSSWHSNYPLLSLSPNLEATLRTSHILVTNTGFGPFARPCRERLGGGWWWGKIIIKIIIKNLEWRFARGVKERRRAGGKVRWKQGLVCVSLRFFFDVFYCY